MSRLLDLDKKETEWSAEIDKCKHKLEEYDKTIQEAQSAKQRVLEEIEKYTRWIHTAREMYGLKIGDLERTTLPGGRETRAEQILTKYDGLSIPEAVKKLLNESAEKGLTATEITKSLLERGFKTNSENFRNVMQNRLHFLTKKGFLTVEKERGENYYSLAKKGIERFLQ